MYDTAATWTALRGLTDRVLALADDITVIVVANSHSAEPEGPEDRSTEYLSDDEANQLLTGLRQSGFRTRFVEGEMTFISAVLERPRLDVTSPLLLVYNLAQSGTDPGRKSLMPAFCALRGLPVCNSNSYAVSLARNKLHVHAVLKRFGLPTPPTWAYRHGLGWLRGERPPSGETLIAKACQESASIGLDAGCIGELSSDYERMLQARSGRLGQPMVVQPLISGFEVESPVVELGGRHAAIGPAMVTIGGDERLGSRILDYDAVARDGYGFALPGPKHSEAFEDIRRISSAACEVLGLSGFARVDFRISDGGGPFVTDVATSPHLVWHSSYSHAFRAAGWGHDGLMAAMVAVNAARLGWI